MSGSPWSMARSFFNPDSTSNGTAPDKNVECASGMPRNDSSWDYFRQSFPSVHLHSLVGTLERGMCHYKT